MRHTLPSVLYEDFDEGVFTKILEIYARVAGIKNPCATSLDPRHQFGEILNALADRDVCELRFGSRLTRHSKLYLYPVFKRDGQHVGFDLDPNTSDDSQKKAVVMREKFLKKVSEYIFTLPMSVN